jgi:hypothetical protein
MHYAKKKYGGVDVETGATLIPGKSSRSLDKRLYGPQNMSERRAEEAFLKPTGLELLFLRHSASPRHRNRGSGPTEYYINVYGTL